MNLWQRAGGFNLVMAFVLGCLLAIGFRAWVLIVAGKQRHQGTLVRHPVVGALFLVLGVLYALFAWPMLIWNYPARILTVGTAALIPILAAWRWKEPAKPHSVWRRVLAGVFVVVLLLTAVDTLLRTGFITLKLHRVAMLVDVTGETRTEASPAVPGQAISARQVTAYHVIVWLANGYPGADVWVYGRKVAFEGKALMVSKAFNRWGVPNLYEFVAIHNGASPSGGATPYFFEPFPHRSVLYVHPWWRPVQNALLAAWATLGKHSPLLGIRLVDNQSPYYPLTDAQGLPLKRRYLLDLTLAGTATSRGSSPLERP